MRESHELTTRGILKLQLLQLIDKKLDEIVHITPFKMKHSD